MTEGRQERSSRMAFVRSSHDKRISLFEVGEASIVRPARCAIRAFEYLAAMTAPPDPDLSEEREFLGIVDSALIGQYDDVSPDYRRAVA